MPRTSCKMTETIFIDIKHSNDTYLCGPDLTHYKHINFRHGPCLKWDSQKAFSTAG
uniref:Uncharacterized protein n=1 Tax=Lepeophtheirus salmonis TaxID=72036 RepID=A0A0K2TKP7_LEPSM